MKQSTNTVASTVQSRSSDVIKTSPIDARKMVSGRGIDCSRNSNNGGPDVVRPQFHFVPGMELCVCEGGDEVSSAMSLPSRIAQFRSCSLTLGIVAIVCMVAAKTCKRFRFRFTGGHESDPGGVHKDTPLDFALV